MRFFLTTSLIVGFTMFFSYGANALTVAPAITEVELDPGTTIEREVTVFNETDQPITVSAQVESFIPQGERGAAQITNNNQAVRWVQLEQSTLTVAPRTAQTVPVLITIPKTASVGGYYVAILWQQSASGASNVNLNGRVGALLLITVKGEVKRSLSIDDFNIVSSGASESLRAVVSIRNDGNVHVKPHGLLVIKNIFNRVVATVPINSEEGNVLPQSTRKFEVAWPTQTISFIDIVKRVAMIRASVYAEVEYDGGMKIISNEQNMWAVSPSLGVSLFIMTLIVLGGGLYVMRKNKKTRS
jgi:hypothetical protein